MNRIALCLLLVVLQAGAASRYFDNAATGGSTGLDWANAWETDAEINWADLGPGDTLFISGGSTTKVYTEDIVIQENGTLTALTGTLTAVSNKVTVTGSSTAFTTELTVGQIFRIGKESRFVRTITSDTALSVDSVYQENHTGEAALRLNAITVRIGQDAGHNGIADFGTNIISRGVSTRFGIIIDGKRNTDATSDPSNWFQVRAGAWTNNIGFWFHNRSNWGQTDENLPNFAFFGGAPADENVFRYIRISGYTNETSGYGHVGREDERGILFHGGAINNRWITNMVFEHLKLDWNSGTQFGFTETTNLSYRGMEARFLLIENMGEDVFEVSRGFSMHDNVIGPVYAVDAHCDIFQLTGSYFQTYNNLIRESGHAYWRLQSQASKDPAAPGINHSIQIFNNIVSEIPGRSPTGGAYNEGITFVNEDSTVEKGGYVTWSNILVANNTIWGSEFSTVPDPDQMMGNSFISWFKGQYVTNAYLKDIRIVNNLIVMRHSGNSFMFDTNTGVLTGAGTWRDYEPFTTNEVVVNYNNFVGTNTSLITDPRMVAHRNVSDEIETHTFRFLNTSNWPAFVDPLSENFELSPSDTAALNQGFDLSDYFSFDSLNRARSSSGVVPSTDWSRGAMESDSDLVVYLSFENDSDGGNATDDSNSQHTGYRFTLSEYSYPSNRTVSALANTQFRPAATGLGKDFLWRTNNHALYQTYLRDGGYFAVTNVHTIITNLEQLTIMCWARYQNNNRTDYWDPNSSKEGSATLISGGTATGIRGSFDLGRYDQDSCANETRFQLNTNNGSVGSWGSACDRSFGDAGKLIMNFPDRGFEQNGNTTNWYHYAITFSNGVVTSYFNGVAYGTNDVSSTTTRIGLGRGNDRPYAPLGIGANIHSGSPQYDDETPLISYPNNGHMNGAMDQVRVYTRCLSWQEIVDVCNIPGAEGAAFADAPEPPAGGGSPAASYGSRKINGINLRR